MPVVEEEDYLAHYGILRKSGRYPWGSGANPKQRSKTFLDIIKQHERDGLSEAQIVKLYQEVGKDGKPIPSTFTVADLRAKKAIAVNIQKQDQVRQAQAWKDKGMGYSEIARRMSTDEKQYNESTIRSLLAAGRKDKLDQLKATADMLKRQVEEKGMIDIGVHVERDIPIGENPETRIGISKDKFNTAVSMLKEEGYRVHTFWGPQQGTGEQTKYKVLVKPGVTQKQAWLNRDNIRLITEKSRDGGRNYMDELAFKKPLSIDPKRIAVRFKEDGGSEHDGMIYVRPNAHDLSLGKSQYAQVRIAVGGTHFLKGMAIYKNDLPSGVDLVFNTNKSKTANKLDVMKPLKKIKENGKDTDKVDWTNPFGAFPKINGGQLKDEHGNVKSAMNILREQGDWNTWSRKISSQMLSKQRPELAEKQLDLTFQRKVQEFERIKHLINPLIKRRLLETFADEVDSSAVHLKAANMPRQATKVILPVTSMKPTEVYAPSHTHGERVVLVRFPHAGTFEIPELTVNNRNPEAKALFTKAGTKELHAPDAIGIHPKVAERLSGADFDGDHVVLIPNRRKEILSTPPLEGLKGFDPQKYKVPTPDEDPVNGRITVPKESVKQDQMGRVTNLISDMTVRGAEEHELAAAVRHSMVVIDSEKHNLDFKASERDNGIIALKHKYQGTAPNGQPRGASTLTTRATSRSNPDPFKRKDARSDHPGSGKGVTRLSNATVDNRTGKKVYELTGERNKKGELKTFRSKKLAETDDAFTLVSEGKGTRVERIYAAHSNRLKALANEVRLETVRTQPLKRNKSSAVVYKEEVKSLKGKLNDALKNAPLERQAQAVAAAIVAQRRRANPDMEKSELKKIRGQALEEARARTGAKKHRIDITDNEWRAIQAGALSIHQLENVLKNTDVDKLRERATPHDKPVMTRVMEARANSLKNSGATPAEIADALDIPVSTLQSFFEGG
jgi:hypothetical protein